MKKFKTLEGKEIELYGEVKEYGILENDDNYGLYELCDKDNENSFETVDVIEENGMMYVDYDEVSDWADNNIVLGQIINK